MYSLGHEIGHIAAGHCNGRHQPDFFTREFEADYFSQLVNGVTPATNYLSLTVDSALLVKELLQRPFFRKQEIARLRELGVYHALQ